MFSAKAFSFKTFRAVLALICGLVALPAAASAHLQCAPYAREVSGISLSGVASGWWAQAEGRYDRGHTPRKGAVLAFRSTHSMRSGHVATVAKVVDERHVLLNHANWSGPGMIERSALAEDVSTNGDWSEVRVYYAPIGKLGLRASPAFGFIYADKAGGDRLALNETKLASRD